MIVIFVIAYKAISTVLAPRRVVIRERRIMRAGYEACTDYPFHNQ